MNSFGHEISKRRFVGMDALPIWWVLQYFVLKLLFHLLLSRFFGVWRSHFRTKPPKPGHITLFILLCDAAMDFFLQYKILIQGNSGGWGVKRRFKCPPPLRPIPTPYYGEDPRCRHRRWPRSSRGRCIACRPDVEGVGSGGQRNNGVPSPNHMTR